MHCRWYPSMPCSRSRGGGGGGIPACLAGFQAYTQGGSPGPHSRGKLKGLAWGVSRPTLGEGVCLSAGGVCPGVSAWGVCIPACTEVTAVGSTHPTGMHSCHKHLSRILSTVGRGVCLITCWDTHHPGRHHPGQTHPLAQTPPCSDTPQWPMQRTVHILLECFLV